MLTIEWSSCQQRAINTLVVNHNLCPNGDLELLEAQ